MPPPIPRCSSWAYSSLISPSHFSLPRYGSRVGLHIVLFEACSAFTRVAACTLAPSPIRDTLIEGFSHFVTSITAPIASGWSGCRVGLAPTGKRRLCTAHTPSGLSSAVAPQQLSPPNRLPFKMTVARLPLGSEFSGVAAYGADFVLPTNFTIPTIVLVEPGRLACRSSAFLL